MSRARWCALACLLLAGLLLASSTSAATLELRWSACLGDGGAVNRSFACDSNDGQQTLVGSFVLASDLAHVSGVEVVVDVVVAGATLPAWWQFRNAGACRRAALTWATDLPGGAERCVDWASGQAAGGFAAYKAGAFGAGSARIIGVSAVPPQGLADLVAGNEYFAFTIGLRNAKTVGRDACGGCDLGACIALRSIKLTTPVVAQNRLLVPDADSKVDRDARRATWQGGAGVVIPPGRETLECSFSCRGRATPLDRLLAFY